MGRKGNVGERGSTGLCPLLLLLLAVMQTTAQDPDAEEIMYAPSTSAVIYLLVLVVPLVLSFSNILLQVFLVFRHRGRINRLHHTMQVMEKSSGCANIKTPGKGDEYDDVKGPDEYDDVKGPDEYNDVKSPDEYDDVKGPDEYDDVKQPDEYDDTQKESHIYHTLD